MAANNFELEFTRRLFPSRRAVLSEVLICGVCRGAYLEAEGLVEHFKNACSSRTNSGELTMSAMLHIEFVENIEGPKRREQAKFHFEGRQTYERGDVE